MPHPGRSPTMPLIGRFRTCVTPPRVGAAVTARTADERAPAVIRWARGTMNLVSVRNSEQAKGSPWVALAWVGVTLVSLPSIAFWAALATLLLLVHCGDTCPGEGTGPDHWERHWQYTAQAVLAFPGVVVALVGLGLGFSRRRRRLGVALWAASAVSAMAWLAWTSRL